MYKKFNDNEDSKDDIRGENDFMIGEDIVKSGTRTNLRSMEDPHKSYNPQPKEYEGDYYVDPTSSYDYGGVHVNSGITNHCFYILAMNITSTPALEVFFKTMTQLKQKATFQDFAKILRKTAVEYECVKPIEDALTKVNLMPTKSKKKSRVPCFQG